MRKESCGQWYLRNVEEGNRLIESAYSKTHNLCSREVGIGGGQIYEVFSKPNKEGGYGRQLLLCQTFLFKSGFYCDGFERIDGCFGRAISLYSKDQLNQPPTL